MFFLAIGCVRTEFDAWTAATQKRTQTKANEQEERKNKNYEKWRVWINKIICTYRCGWHHSKEIDVLVKHSRPRASLVRCFCQTPSTTNESNCVACHPHLFTRAQVPLCAITHRTMSTSSVSALLLALVLCTLLRDTRIAKNLHKRLFILIYQMCIIISYT